MSGFESGHMLLTDLDRPENPISCADASITPILRRGSRGSSIYDSPQRRWGRLMMPRTNLMSVTGW